MIWLLYYSIFPKSSTTFFKKKKKGKVICLLLLFFLLLSDKALNLYSWILFLNCNLTLYWTCSLRFYVLWSLQITPRLPGCYSVVFSSFIWVFCCDLPQTYKVCHCCELLNTYWKPNRAMSADLSFVFLFVFCPFVVCSFQDAPSSFQFPWCKSDLKSYILLSYCCYLPDVSPLGGRKIVYKIL